MELSKFQEFFLHKMVHPTVATGWLKGSKIPSRILLNEVPDTSFVAQGIKEGLYDGSGPSPMEPSFNVLTDGHISLLNFYSGNMGFEELSAMPVYFAAEMPEEYIPEGWPKTMTNAEAHFMFMIKDPADIDGIKKISINGIDYDTYVIHSEDDMPSEPPSTPTNIIILMVGEEYFQPISSEEINEMEEQLNGVKEELAEMEAEDPDNPQIELSKAYIFIYENMIETSREFVNGYMLLTMGNIISLNGLSGNIPFTLHTEYEEGAEEGNMEGTLYEFVEPVYLNWSDDIRWDSNSHSYYIYISGYGGCTPQYATFDKSGNMVVNWTDIDSDSSYIYVSNPKEVRIAARGVSGSGAVVVDPIYQDLYWPHITYQVNTNVSNPGDIQIQIDSTFSDYYYTYPTDSIPSSQEDTPVTGYEMSYSFDGITWIPIEVALPVWDEYGDGYWHNRDTVVYIQDRWGSNHLRLKVKYSGENGPACECIYEQKDISVAVPDPEYNGLIVRTDGTGADVSMNYWNTPHAGTWYKIDDGEWIKYYNSDTISYNRPSITDSDLHTLYIQNKTDDGEHVSSVLEVPIQITQKPSPVYITFTAGEEGASITCSRNGNSLCQYSSDHENWETWTTSYNSESKLLEANEVLYVRNFGEMPAFNTIAGSVTVEGSLDALISPCWDIVPMNRNIQRNFQGNMDCSTMTLFSYDFGKINTGNASTYGYLFSKNTGTKSFTNFDSIQSYERAYDYIFSGSSLESTDNLQPGYAYYHAFAGSNLTEIPVLPTLTKITSDGQYYYWPYERIFNDCSIDVVDDQGNWNFGENNFDFSQGSVLGCSSPKALAEWLGIFDPDWRIYLSYVDNVKNLDIHAGEPINNSSWSSSANIYVDQIPAEGISFQHSVPGAGWLLRYDLYGEGTMVSNNSECLLVPDGIHGSYYLRVAKNITINIDVEMEGGGEIPEGVFEITQTKLYNGGERPDTIISNTPCNIVIDNCSQSLGIYYSHESGYTVSAQRSLDGGTTWSNMNNYDDRYFYTGFVFNNIPDSIDIKITVEHE